MRTARSCRKSELKVANRRRGRDARGEGYETIGNFIFGPADRISVVPFHTEPSRDGAETASPTSRETDSGVQVLKIVLPYTFLSLWSLGSGRDDKRCELRWLSAAGDAADAALLQSRTGAGFAATLPS